MRKPRKLSNRKFAVIETARAERRATIEGARPRPVTLDQVPAMPGEQIMAALITLRDERSDIVRQSMMVTEDGQRISRMMPGASGAMLRQLTEERRANTLAMRAMDVRMKEIKALISALSIEEGKRFERVLIRLVKAHLPAEQYETLCHQAKTECRQ